MIDATDTALDQGPESLNRVRMYVPIYVHPLTMVDAMVCVTPRVKPVVGLEIIGKDHRSRQYVFLDKSAQCVSFNIGGDECANLSLALNHANDGSLVGSASACSLGAAPVVRLIHFDLAVESAQRAALVVIQHRTNLFEHAPRGFVGDASLPLDLLCGDTATGLRHEVDRVEPSGQRSGRFVKDRFGGRVNVMTAMVARVRRATLNAVMLCDRVARFAKDAVWVQVVAEPFQAGRIVWKLLLEVFQCVRQHVRLAVVVRHKEFACV